MFKNHGKAIRPRFAPRALGRGHGHGYGHRYGRRGFTLIEVMAALAILVVGLSGFLAIFSAGLHHALDVKQCLSGPPAAQTAVTYAIASGAKPVDAEWNVPEVLNGYAITLRAGRMEATGFVPGEKENAGADTAGDLYTLRVRVYENPTDRDKALTPMGIYYLRAWYRK